MGTGHRRVLRTIVASALVGASIAVSTAPASGGEGLPPSEEAEVSAEDIAGEYCLDWAWWSEPGDPHILSYDVARVGGTTMTTVPSRSGGEWICLVGLPHGVPHTYQVRARNAYGVSDWVVAEPVVLGPYDWYFDDAPPGHAFFGAIHWALLYAVADGAGDGHFGVRDPLRRQEAVAWLWKEAGSFEHPAPDPFVDVTPTHPFYEPIAWAAEEGLVAGYPDGTFRPTAVVTRAAFVSILWRLVGSPSPPPGAPSFVDVPAGHPAAAAIRWAAADGVTAGYGDGTFRPGAVVTRQEGIAFLANHFRPRWTPITD